MVRKRSRKSSTPDHYGKRTPLRAHCRRARDVRALLDHGQEAAWAPSSRTGNLHARNWGGPRRWTPRPTRSRSVKCLTHFSAHRKMHSTLRTTPNNPTMLNQRHSTYLKRHPIHHKHPEMHDELACEKHDVSKATTVTSGTSSMSAVLCRLRGPTRSASRTSATAYTGPYSAVFRVPTVPMSQTSAQSA